MTKVVAFCVAVAFAWGGVVYVTCRALYGLQAPDWTVAPAFLGGIGIGLWAFYFSLSRWAD